MADLSVKFDYQEPLRAGELGQLFVVMAQRLP